MSKVLDLISGLVVNRSTTRASSISTPLSSVTGKEVINAEWAKLGFAFSTNSNGYLKLPDWLGGFILQWGKVTSSGSSPGNATVTFPLPFPNECLQAVGQVARSGSASVYTVQMPATLGTTTMAMTAVEGSTTPVIGNNIDVRWIAIGR